MGPAEHGRKNRLLPADARRIEDAFRARLERLSANTSEVVLKSNATRSRRTKGVDKSALTLPEPRRVRDRAHLRSVAQKACLVCARKPSDPHHLRFAQSRAMGQKVSDEFAVPLCRGHHRESALATRRHGGTAKVSTRRRQRGHSGLKAIRCPTSTVAPQLHWTMLSAPNYRRRVYLPKSFSSALTRCFAVR
jgi:hypothetical protein